MPLGLEQVVRQAPKLEFATHLEALMPETAQPPPILDLTKDGLDDLASEPAAGFDTSRLT
jgi:hypothetical protein